MEIKPAAKQVKTMLDITAIMIMTLVLHSSVLQVFPDPDEPVR